MDPVQVSVSRLNFVEQMLSNGHKVPSIPAESLLVEVAPRIWSLSVDDRFAEPDFVPLSEYFQRRIEVFGQRMGIIRIYLVEDIPAVSAETPGHDGDSGELVERSPKDVDPKYVFEDLTVRHERVTVEDPDVTGDRTDHRIRHKRDDNLAERVSLDDAVGVDGNDNLGLG